jgi:hypothetical protein
MVSLYQDLHVFCMWHDCVRNPHATLVTSVTSVIMVTWGISSHPDKFNGTDTIHKGRMSNSGGSARIGMEFVHFLTFFWRTPSLNPPRQYISEHYSAVIELHIYQNGCCIHSETAVFLYNFQTLEVKMCIPIVMWDCETWSLTLR